MKFIDEYRDGKAAGFAKALARITTRPWTLMEVCGGQTHAIVKFGVDELLPRQVTLVHGPGCPVCVTPLELIEKALEIAARSNVTFCSFGDMLRVLACVPICCPSRRLAATRIVYSPLDAVELAKQLPERGVPVGFETTAPANAMAVFQAARQEVPNFSMLVSHVLVPPAMEAILRPKQPRPGILAAGHVCTIMGFTEYEPLAAKYRAPIVVTGFEPLDILQGVYMCVKQLEEGRAEVENQYVRAVRRQGNLAAQRLVTEVFEVVPRKWRGVGEIPASGLGLRAPYRRFDAEARFGLEDRRHRRARRVHERPDHAGTDEAARVPSFGTVHARTSAGRHDGVLGGRVRGLLPVSPRPPRAGRQWELGHVHGHLRRPVPPAHRAAHARAARPRRRRQAHQSAARTALPSGVQQRCAGRAARWRPLTMGGATLRSRPTPTSFTRCSSPAPTSAASPSTAP